MTKYLSLLLCISLLTGCATAPVPAPVTPSGASSQAPDKTKLPLRPKILYLNTEASELLIFVYRGGRLAHLGHNHVLAAKEIKGLIYYHPDITLSGFDISIPVHSLEVDREEFRKRGGADFNKPVTATNIAGTRRNIMSERVLDERKYPFIHFRSHRLSGTRPSISAGIEVTLKGTTRLMPAQFQLHSESGQLIASGTLILSQQDFGITPLSILGGAITVQDQLHIHYRLVANIPEENEF